MVGFNEDDSRKISEAIAAAEKATSAEISCIVTHSVSAYREIPLFWAAIVSLLLLPLLIMSGHLPLDIFSSGWNGSSTKPHIADYILLQLVSFGLVFLIASIPVITRLLTPGFFKSHRARQVAQHHFVAAQRYLAPPQPHFMIFVSLADHCVEIITSDNIRQIGDEKIERDAAAAIREGMKSGQPSDGLANAITLIGVALSPRFPAGVNNPNSLPDGVVHA